VTFTGNVLALDLATTTGWAYGEPGGIPVFGNLRFGSKGSRASSYREFRAWLDANWTSSKPRMRPALIVYESPMIPSLMGGKTRIETTKLLFGFAEHIEEWAYDRIELREASVGQVRSHFIGQNLKAKIAKPMVMERCHELGWMCQTTDESDACALWDYQCCFLAPQLSFRTTRLFQKLK
jgi:hypothetical protein